MNRAQYCAAPVPLAHLLCMMYSPPDAKPAGFVHSTAEDAPVRRDAPVAQADYIAALSKTEWRSSAELSEALNVGQSCAKKRMMGKAMAAITEIRRVGNRFEWRLL